jgi:hypothetical protein
MVRELAFDLKARASERTKTPDEIAREERDKLLLLEVNEVSEFYR